MRRLDVDARSPPSLDRGTMSSSRLLLLDNALDHGLYRPLDHWSAVLGFVPEHVHVPTSRELPAPGAHGHVIISGSEGSILDDTDWSLRELEWVRQAARLGVRMLGSCWGHQLIAYALGSRDCIRRATAAELGWTHVAIDRSDGPFTESFDAFVSHFDEVVVGSHPSIRVVAGSEDCAVQIMRWGEASIWGVQAHPEIDPATGRAFLEAGIERWPAHAAAFRQALAGPSRDSGFGRRLAARFLAT